MQPYGNTMTAWVKTIKSALLWLDWLLVLTKNTHIEYDRIKEGFCLKDQKVSITACKCTDILEKINDHGIK